MKIIKEGDVSKTLRIKRFECKECGCIFEADKNEYETSSDYRETVYRIECPTCGNRVCMH